MRVAHIAGTEFPEDAARNRLSRQIGLCDIDLGTDGVQAGIPELQEGDYTRFRRQAD